MKKKTKKSIKSKQKIDVVLESLLNLERVVKELVAQIEQLRYGQSRFKDTEIDPKKYWPNNPQSPLSPQSPPPPNHPQPYVVWCNHQSESSQKLSALKECKDQFYNHNSDIGWDAIDKGLQ